MTRDKKIDAINSKELATLLGQSIGQTRRIIRRHMDILQPFKMGRENYFLTDNVNNFIARLTSGELNKK